MNGIEFHGGPLDGMPVSEKLPNPARLPADLPGGIMALKRYSFPEPRPPEPARIIHIYELVDGKYRYRSEEP